DHDLTLGYVRTRLNAWLAIPPLVVLAGVLASFKVAPGLVLLWGGGVLIAHALVLVACRRYAELPAEQIAMQAWRRRFVVLELVQGAVWAGLFLLPGDGSGLGVALDFAAILIVIAAASMLASDLPPAVVSAVVPVS